MTAPSLLGVGAALAFVLALIALLVRVVRGFAPGTLSDRSPRLEVLARVGLAPKQGLAAVRFGDRTALVSWGEGGVRMLMEEDGAAVSADAAGRDRPAPAPAATFGALLSGARSRQAASGHPVPEPNGLVASAAATGGASRAIPWLARRFKGAMKTAGFGLVVVLASATAPSLAGATPVTSVASTAASWQSQAGTNQAGAPTGSPANGAGRPVEDLLAEALRSMGVGGGGTDEEGGLRLVGPVGTVIFLGFLTLLPTLLLLMTSFTRILVVLHLLKQAIGTQTAPPAHLLAAMALLLTGFVMSPTLAEVNRTALTPWMDGAIDEAQMLSTASVPFRNFMLEGAREADLASFVDMSGTEPETVDDIPLVVVTSAFVTSELTNAFKMGFALFLPFIVIDIVVASILMSMGMFMLPPVMVSLPFKLLLFVLVDGWSLVVSSLVRSF